MQVITTTLDYLKNTIASVEKKVSKERDKCTQSQLEVEKLKRNIIDLKKENKKRRRIGNQYHFTIAIC